MFRIEQNIREHLKVLYTYFFIIKKRYFRKYVKKKKEFCDK